MEREEGQNPVDDIEKDDAVPDEMVDPGRLEPGEDTGRVAEEPGPSDGG